MSGRLVLVLLCLSVILFSAQAASCGASTESSEKSSEEEGEVKQFFSNLGCNIQKGAKKIGEQAKRTYDYVKDKIKQIQDDDGATTTTTPSGPTTEGASIDVRQDNGNTTSITSDSTTPKSIDDRFLFDTPVKCPDGQKIDQLNRCRNA